MPIPLWLYLNEITNYHQSASVRVSVRRCECDGVSQLLSLSHDKDDMNS